MGVTAKLELINPELYEKALQVLPAQAAGRFLGDIAPLFQQFGKDFTAFCKCYSVEPDLPMIEFSMNGLFCYLITIDSCELDKSLAHGFRILFGTVRQLLPVKRLLIELEGFDYPVRKQLMDDDGGLFGVWKASSLVEAQRTIHKYADWNVLKSELEASPERVLGKVFGTKKKQIEAMNIFKEEYYREIWKELHVFLNRAVEENRFVGISIFP
jgi:hypothetical protein